MYLSKITILPFQNMAHVLLKLDRNGAYSAHQLLWQLFSQEKARQFIYRQEIGPSGSPVFFVLSSCEPEMHSDIFQVQTKRFHPALQQGQRLAFKLRVNPTICITDENQRSRRHDVLMHAKRQLKSDMLSDIDLNVHMNNAAHQWICDKTRLSTWGITLDTLPDIEAYTQHHSKKKSGHQVQFSSVDFQGLLTVDDPDKFLSQYEKGFGRAKALGCGLMLIRSV